MLTVKELSVQYGVTKMAVRFWIAAGCPHETERVIGRKDRIVLDKQKVDEWLSSTVRRTPKEE